MQLLLSRDRGVEPQEAGWAMNPKTLRKDSYNSVLPPSAWGYIWKSGRCFCYFQKWKPGQVCDKKAVREIPSMQESLNLVVVTDHRCPLPTSECNEHITVEDALESPPITELENASELQEVSQPVIVYSSLATISVVCDEIVAMDLEKSPLIIPQKQKQKSVLRTPQIWTPTPKPGVLAHTTIDNRVTNKVDLDDGMIPPRVFKQIRKICNHSLTWDACANNKVDNALCS